MTATFNVTGSRPKARAISGIAVTITFASTLSMNIAHATMRGAMKALTASGMVNRDRHLAARAAIMAPIWSGR
ncbi:MULTISPECIES: hypothetical protein [unclassified Caballeronia]|uniref:hypothetical protein n=1 Tax=unclassified Caballeronia TaxID=2646786 RepID=UPI001F2C4958|nr:MULTISPECIES: hypothetical protein [unclassified Caballeronia]MCE4543764.1 hypothetical protein [Caballeronia sp. PC1]MCE4567179.1 hypothetical protein [Caballeronia sp. CLC5]